MQCKKHELLKQYVYLVVSKWEPLLTVLLLNAFYLGKMSSFVLKVYLTQDFLYDNFNKEDYSKFLQNYWKNMPYSMSYVKFDIF